MTDSPSRSEPSSDLVLTDGTTWNIVPKDIRAAQFVLHLQKIMCLGQHLHPGRKLVIRTENNDTIGIPALDEVSAANTAAPSGLMDERVTHVGHGLRFYDDHEGTVICSLRPEITEDLLTAQLTQVAMVLATAPLKRGGVLLHGALAERNNCGIILAGPGGAGKTTACRRISPHWRTLCDDTTLVVRDKHGAYWGHPWPTWSRFLFGGTGGSWDVRHAVPLKAIFFLCRAETERFELVGKGQAVTLLVELAEQVLFPILKGMDTQNMRSLRMLVFDNICTLVKSVTGYLLYLGKSGSFCSELEKILDISENKN
ncbi:SynChlorMet cassette protein ScmC [Thermodesulfobacteriota bacterium]